MKKIIKVNDKQWAELDEVHDRPMTAKELAAWLAGMGFMVVIIILICVLGGVLQGGTCK